MMGGGVGCSLFGGGGSGIRRAKWYTVNPPTEWQASDRYESDQAYKLPSGSVVTLTSSCDRRTDSLELLTRHLLIGTRNVVMKKRETFKVSETEGMYSSVSATLEGVPINLELFVLPKDSCVFDFTLLSRETISDNELEQFLSFIKSFSHGKN